MAPTVLRTEVVLGHSELLSLLQSYPYRDEWATRLTTEASMPEFLKNIVQYYGTTGSTSTSILQPCPQLDLRFATSWTKTFEKRRPEDVLLHGMRCDSGV